MLICLRDGHQWAVPLCSVWPEPNGAWLQQEAARHAAQLEVESAGGLDGLLKSTERDFSRLCTDVGTPLDELQHFSCHPEMKERLSENRWPRDAARGWGHLETSGFEGAVLRMLEAGTAFDGDRVRGQIVKLMASAMRCLSEMGMGADVNASDALEPW